MGWRGLLAKRRNIKTILYLRNMCFVIEKYIEDLRQEEKQVPDLLESVMKPTDPVKEELRPNLITLKQFGSNMPKSKVSTFWTRKSQVFLPVADASLLASKF